jgi:hypothetical protein
VVDHLLSHMHQALSSNSSMSRKKKKKQQKCSSNIFFWIIFLTFPARVADLSFVLSLYTAHASTVFFSSECYNLSVDVHLLSYTGNYTVM